MNSEGMDRKTIEQPSVRLNDGNSMPQFGFGVWQISRSKTARVTRAAIRAGYRSIDTAAVYENEAEVGQALATKIVARDEMFITTKLWNNDHGYDETMKAFGLSMGKLGLERLDLYLIHQPCSSPELNVESWKAMIKLQKDGRVNSIGVSNFTVENLRHIISETEVVPAVNQIELHPYYQQHDLRAFHKEMGIATQSWSPLAGGRLMKDDLLIQIAEKYKKTVAQVVLRWHMELGLIAIPKSVKTSRIAENIAIFDFRLDAGDIDAIASLHRDDWRQ